MAGQPQQRATLEAVGRWLKAEQREYVATLKQFGLSTDNAVIGREFKRTSDPAEYQQLVTYLEQAGKIKEKPKAPPRPRAERLPKGDGWHRIPHGYEGTFQGRHWIIIYKGKPNAAGFGGWDLVMQVHQGEYDAEAVPADELWSKVARHAKRGARYVTWDPDTSITKEQIDLIVRAEKYRRQPASAERNPAKGYKLNRDRDGNYVLHAHDRQASIFRGSRADGWGAYEQDKSGRQISDVTYSFHLQPLVKQMVEWLSEPYDASDVPHYYQSSTYEFPSDKPSRFKLRRNPKSRR